MTKIKPTYEELENKLKILENREKKYRELVDNMVLGIYRVTQEGKLIMVNQRMADIFGYTSAEAMMAGVSNISQLYAHPEQRPEILREIRNKGFVRGKEVEFREKNGKAIFLKLNTTTKLDRIGNLVFEGIMEDVTEFKTMEAQLQQAQKMEAIGTLAGGIAHDFNNLLMGMQGRTSLMRIGKGASHPDLEHLKGIKNAIISASDLTRQLLGFARGGKYEAKPTDINELIDNSSDMFGRAKKEITIHRIAQKGVWSVEVDQTQIEQVLLNLFVNAWQAMDGTGELFIETKNVVLDREFVRPHGIDPGRYVKISVKDTGTGIEEATKLRIFDPFFTTKEVSRGTGLGLASAHGIVKSHDGMIEVNSKKGHGATFNIYLPASEKKIVEKKPSFLKLHKGSETVLLVDDEDTVVEVGQKVLEAMGYTVLCVKTGRDAIETYKKNKDGIDLVILDMVMPEMGGDETYDRLKKIDPNIKVLLSSGYSIEGLANAIMKRGCNGFIQKPFGIKNLSQKIRNVLDRK